MIHSLGKGENHPLSDLFSVFFDYLYFQIVEIDFFDPVVLTEFGFAVALEIRNIGIQPDRNSQIPGVADTVESPEYFVRPCFFGVIADHQIFCCLVVFQDQPAPESKHVCILSAGIQFPASVFSDTISCGFGCVKFPCIQEIIILYWNQPAKTG